MKKAYGKLPFPKMSPILLSRIESGEVYDLGVVRSHDILGPGHPFRYYPTNGTVTQKMWGAPALYNEMQGNLYTCWPHMDASAISGKSGQIRLSWR